MKKFHILGVYIFFFVMILLPPPGYPQEAGFFSIDEEVFKGQKFYRELEKGDIKDIKVCSDTKITRKIIDIGNRLAKVSMKRKGVDYKFIAVEGKMKQYYNAFSAPGGYICISKDLCKDLNENELAFIIAHEMVHTDNADYLVHINMEKALEDQDKVMIKTGYSKVSIDIEALMKSYGRKKEYAADAYGALYLYRAGYNPEAGLTAIDKLSKNSGGDYEKGLEEWVDHPTFGGRQDNLRNYLNKMKYIETLFARGVTKLQRYEPDDAIECFTKFLSIFYGSPQAYNNLGYAYFLKAMKSWQEGGWYWTEGTDPVYERDFLADRGEQKESVPDIVALNNAVVSFNQALEYHPDYERALNNLIIAYWQMGEKDKAQKEITRFEKATSQSPEYYNTIGIISFSQGNGKKAESCFQKALKLKKDYLPSYFNLGLMNQKCNNSKSAKEYFSQFLNLNKDSQNPWAEAARKYIEK